MSVELDEMKPSVVLVLDSCGERASVALAGLDGGLLAEELLPVRAVSTRLLVAVRSLMESAGVSGVNSLAALGVVHGPGSFTGVRVGLAVAKGLAEAANLPLAAVSRLAVLAGAGTDCDLCAVHAGRNELYVRLKDEHGVSERLLSDMALRALQPGASITVDSEMLAGRLLAADRGRQVVVLEITAASAIPLVLRQLAQGGCDVGMVDANYVRDESTIYRRPVL